MKLFVKSWEHNLRHHVCLDEQGKTHRVDLQVDGGLGNVTDEFLVGKTVECESLQAYEELANSLSWPIASANGEK